MKKFLTIIASVLCLQVLANAQNMYDGATFAETEYYGSARTMGLGNAVTAIGGDLGTIGINPAGSAVAGYSQFTITPAITRSSTSTSWADSSLPPFTAVNGNRNHRFMMPNIGFSARFESEYPYTLLRSMTFSVVSNTETSYHEDFIGCGQTSASSMFAEMAAVATDNNLPKFSYDDVSADLWDIVLAGNVGLINGFGTHGEYVGATEVLDSDGNHYVPGTLLQNTHVSRYGTKNDLVFNFGYNFVDKLFLGFNLGIPISSYSNTITHQEVAKDVDLFPVTFTSGGKTTNTNFSDASYTYSYMADMVGINLKFGVIWLPTDGLRLGAAIKTRTSFDVSEVWQHGAEVNYLARDYSASGVSKRGEYEYYFSTPWSWNVGAAYTLGRLGLLSVDYEMTCYDSMRFFEVEDQSSYFSELNQVIKKFYGARHNLRVGAEINVTPQIAVRGGYTLMTDPEKYYTGDAGDITSDVYCGDDYDDYRLGRKTLPSEWSYYSDTKSTWSVGLGYKSYGSFFMDAALMCVNYPKYNYKPYYDYHNYKYDSVNNAIVSTGMSYSPSMTVSRHLWAAAVTFGWRF